MESGNKKEIRETRSVSGVAMERISDIIRK